MKISVVTVLLNLALYFPMIHLLGFAGLAAATSIAAFVNFGLVGVLPAVARRAGAVLDHVAEFRAHRGSGRVGHVAGAFAAGGDFFRVCRPYYRVYSIWRWPLWPVACHIWRCVSHSGSRS